MREGEDNENEIQHLRQKIAELERIKKEYEESFALFEQRAKEYEEKRKQQELEIEKMKRKSELDADPRFKIFTAAVGGSTISLKSAYRVEFNEHYQNKCLFCNSSSNLSRAYLVVGSKDDTIYADIRKDRGYKTDLEVDVMKNFILLCGSHGANDTCHDDFDKYVVTLIYNPLTKEYLVFHLDPTTSRQRSIHLKVVNVPDDEKVRRYHRLLSCRTRYCLHHHSYLKKSSDAESIVALSRMSEESRSVSHENEEEGATISVGSIEIP